MVEPKIEMALLNLSSEILSLDQYFHHRANRFTWPVDTLPSRAIVAIGVKEIKLFANESMLLVANT